MAEKALKNLSLVLIFVSIFIPFAFSQETLTITTYYPSPYGSYNELRSERMALGYTGRDEACWDPPCPGGGTDISDNGTRNIDLIVEGNVGIGTVNPSGQFTIKNPDALWGTFEVFNTGAGANNDIRFDGGSDSLFAFWNYGSSATGGTSFRSSTVSNILFMQNNGNVGIVATNPQSKLDIRAGTAIGLTLDQNNSTDVDWLRFTYSSGLPDIDVTGNYGSFRMTSNAVNYVIGPDVQNFAFTGGNVGIGTTSPDATLDVSGGVKIGTEVACNAAKAGTLRYDAGTNAMQFCNGTGWMPLGGALSNCSIVSADTCGRLTSATATCPAGTTRTGGGYQLLNWFCGCYAPDNSMPVAPNGWQITIGGCESCDNCMRAWAVCCQ